MDNDNKQLNFETYLKHKKYRKTTLTQHLANVNRFIKWCVKTAINYENVTYNELLNFINSMQNRAVSKGNINSHLASITHYLNYLIAKKIRKDNPCKALRIKNNDKKVVKHLLTVDELDNIYLNFTHLNLNSKQYKITHLRNSVIVGLIVYQALQNKELQKLEVNHINLTTGKLYIPSVCRTNSRHLKLSAVQIIALQNYINTLPKTQETLFKCSINGVINVLIKLLKSSNSNMYSMNQLRKSVIVNWLKMYNIRQVQYMTGHRYISSTEAYKLNDLSDLQSALELHHPMK